MICTRHPETMCKPTPSDRKQIGDQGFSLVAVLLLLSVLSAVAIPYSLSLRSEIQMQRTARETADFLRRSRQISLGLSYGYSNDDFEYLAAGPDSGINCYQDTKANQRLYIDLLDGTSAININAVAPAVMAEKFEALGLLPAIAATLAQRIENFRNNSPELLVRAESSEKEFEHIAELMDLEGLEDVSLTELVWAFQIISLGRNISSGHRLIVTVLSVQDPSMGWVGEIETGNSDAERTVSAYRINSQFYAPWTDFPTGHRDKSRPCSSVLPPLTASILTSIAQ